MFHQEASVETIKLGKNFSNNDDLKSHWAEFFAVKDQKFYQHGIMKLPERWQKVIKQKGRYLTD